MPDVRRNINLFGPEAAVAVIEIIHQSAFPLLSVSCSCGSVVCGGGSGGSSGRYSAPVLPQENSITHINSTKGNGDYTIEEPLHYPFTESDNAALQWINEQLVKAKPSFHKKTFLKPLHKTAEFCSACHKVHLPYEVNHYKEFLRGQNHYDPFLLSGVSGHAWPAHTRPPAQPVRPTAQPDRRSRESRLRGSTASFISSVGRSRCTQAP